MLVSSFRVCNFFHYINQNFGKISMKFRKILQKKKKKSDQIHQHGNLPSTCGLCLSQDAYVEDWKCVQFSLSYSVLTSNSTIIKISLLTLTHWLLGFIPIIRTHMNIFHKHSSDCLAICQATDNISFNSHNARRPGTLLSINDKVTKP